MPGYFYTALNIKDDGTMPQPQWLVKKRTCRSLPLSSLGLLCRIRSSSSGLTVGPPRMMSESARWPCPNFRRFPLPDRFRV